MAEIVVYTIGHSDHTIDEFVRLLLRNGVRSVVDVRSVGEDLRITARLGL